MFSEAPYIVVPYSLREYRKRRTLGFRTVGMNPALVVRVHGYLEPEVPVLGSNSYSLVQNIISWNLESDGGVQTCFLNLD